MVLLGPWYLEPRSPVTSHGKVQQNLLPGTAWAAELLPAVDPEPETPRLPSSSVHISLMMMHTEDNSCLTPSPASHTDTRCGAASAHQTEREQQLDVTLRCPRALELHPQAGSWSQAAAQPPSCLCFQWPSSTLGNWIMALIDPLGFPLRFRWWSSERGHLSLPRLLPTYQRAELISLELLASNQEPDSKNILELLKTESVTNKMCSWIHRAPSQSVLARLKKGLPAHTTDGILYFLYRVVHSIHHQDADDGQTFIVSRRYPSQLKPL